jgi:hypothetical protein
VPVPSVPVPLLELFHFDVDANEVERKRETPHKLARALMQQNWPNVAVWKSSVNTECGQRKCGARERGKYGVTR